MEGINHGNPIIDRDIHLRTDSDSKQKQNRMCPQPSETNSNKSLVIDNGTPPNEKEKELIKEFRGNVKDILVTEEYRSDQYLLRWIRAREGNLDKAEEMLRNHMEWRKKNEIDQCLKKPLDPLMPENYKYHFKTKDREGRPIIEVHTGSWDLRKAMDAGKEDEFQHFINHFFESLLGMIRASGKMKNSPEWPHTQFVYFSDWSGYQYGQLIHRKAISAFLKMGSQYEAHYPEVVHSVYCVNCPSFMPVLMALLKPILAPKTYEKIKLFGGNREEWEPILTGIAEDPEKLWTRFGGKRVEEQDESSA